MANVPITLNPKFSVLVVEDNPERIAYFREKLKGYDLTVATTPAEGVKAVESRRFDVVFLDHDAVPVFVKPDDPNHDTMTFFPVAKALAAQKYNGNVIIHSFNPVGAIRMQILLGRTAFVKRIPFGQFTLVKG